MMARKSAATPIDPALGSYWWRDPTTVRRDRAKIAGQSTETIERRVARIKYDIASSEAELEMYEAELARRATAGT